jgi:hypothetical protein
MNMLKHYGWEGTLAGILAGIMVILTVVTHLTAHPERSDGASLRATPAVGPAAFHPMPDRVPVASTTRPMRAAVSRKPAADRRASGSSRPSDPLEVVVVPSPISGQFRLLASSRTSATPTSDKLTLRLRVLSHAVADLVTPFQSAMLELRTPGLEPINPEHPFSYPVPAGNSREEDIVFVIPSNLDLDRAVLRIHYYNELKEIPLAALPKDSRH